MTFNLIISTREKDYLKKVKRHLQGGNPLVFPTDTVYGIGVSLQNERSLKRVIEIKEREEIKPISIMCFNLEEAEKYFEFDEILLKVAKKFLPGELTLILKRKETIPSWYYPDFQKIGLRIPSNSVALEILKNYNEIIAVTSANKSGMEDAKDIKTAIHYFGKYSDVLFVDGGRIENGQPSAVIEIDGGEIKILRKGKISLKKILEACNEKGF